MQGMLVDIRSGFRILTRSPGPALLAILILSIGIGLTTAMFSIVYGIILRGLPIENADELLHIEAQRLDQGIDAQQVTLPEFLYWRQHQKSFLELHAFRAEAVSFSGDGLPERLIGAEITPGAFSQLGIKLAYGRAFTEADAEAGAEPVALIGSGFWHRHFGGDLGVLGKTARINGHPVRIVGIMPEGFQFPALQEIWLPLTLEMGSKTPGQGNPDLHVFGRLRRGVGIEQARADLETISSRMAAQYPETEAGLGVSVRPYGDYFIDQDDISLSWTSLGAVSFVLLIACFNVANLLLARSSRRARELAVRSVLGASRWRMARQVLGESFALSLVGAAAGTGLAFLLIDQFNLAVADQNWPFWFDVRMDWPAVVFVVGCTLLVSALAGAIPAWRSSRLQVGAVLKDESHGSRRGRVSTGLVIAEVALSFTLLIGAGLMVRTLVNLGNLHFSFPTAKLFAGRITLTSDEYPETDTLNRTWEAIERRVEALPEVAQVTIADRAPAAEWAPMTRYAIDPGTSDQPEDRPWARKALVDVGFFKTLGVEAVAGRTFTAHDRGGSLPVAVVNRSFAASSWPDASAVGKQVRIDPVRGGTGTWYTVVGVVPDVNAGGPRDQRPAAIYLPLRQSTTRSAVLLARVRGDVDAAILPIRNAVAEVDPDLPIDFAGNLQQKISQQLFFYRIVATIFGAMAAVALLLAVTGLYGLLSFSVNQRTSELGIRMAIGASAREVLLLVVRTGLRQVLVGLFIGLGLALLVTRLLQSQLVGVNPYDLTTFLLVGLALVCTGIAAVLIPALKASRLDPMKALHYE